jgi:hypothetical protein
LQNAVCCHCLTEGQLVSHSYTYNKSSLGKPAQPVDKRSPISRLSLFYPTSVFVQRATDYINAIKLGFFVYKG